MMETEAGWWLSSQGMARFACNNSELAEARKDASLSDSEGSWLCWQLDFRLLAAARGVTKSRTWLSDFTFTFHFHALEKEVATHSSVFAWRIPGMGEPGGLPSMGSHRVRQDWSNFTAAATASRTVKQNIPVVLSHMFCGTLYQQSQETHTEPHKDSCMREKQMTPVSRFSMGTSGTYR